MLREELETPGELYNDSINSSRQLLHICRTGSDKLRVNEYAERFRHQIRSSISLLMLTEQVAVTGGVKMTTQAANSHLSESAEPSGIAESNKLSFYDLIDISDSQITLASLEVTDGVKKVYVENSR